MLFSATWPVICQRHNDWNQSRDGIAHAGTFIRIARSMRTRPQPQWLCVSRTLNEQAYALQKFWLYTRGSAHRHLALTWSGWRRSVGSSRVQGGEPSSRGIAVRRRGGGIAFYHWGALRACYFAHDNIGGAKRFPEESCARLEDIRAGGDGQATSRGRCAFLPSASSRLIRWSGWFTSH